MDRLRRSGGQGLVEYILVVLLMAILAIGTIKRLGTRTHNAFAQSASALENQMNFTQSNYGRGQSIDDN